MSSSGSDIMLQVNGVKRSFHTGSATVHVLKGIEMTLHAKQLVMLKGRSGSGKTTLLNLIGGLDTPSEGEVVFGNQAFHSLSDNKRTEIRRKHIGIIFQTFALMPLLTAWENVELSLRMAGVPQAVWNARIKECLELVGLGKRSQHRPYELSGGEQQRVAVAKAIAHRPRLLLADEPTAELDTLMTARVMAIFREIVETENISICMTTHDSSIWEAADHVYEMADGTIVSA